MAFNDRIKEARQKKKLTQEQLAGQIGVAKSTVTGYEKGNSEPSIDTMMKIMSVLEIDANYLWQDEMKNLSPKDNVTSLEYEHIKKYRALDPTGQNHVDTVLKWEAERVFHQNLVLENETDKDEVPVYILSYYRRLASAGTGEYLFDNIPTDTIEVPITDLSSQSDFVIGVSGDSMEPTYKDGDKVYVKIAEEIPIGHIGAFTRENECFIKEFGVDRLISHNINYLDIPASKDIRLVGEVLGKVEETD